MFSFTTTAAFSALIASLAIPTAAHTWIEEYQVIGSNGSYIGPRGFSRGYVGRTDADFDGSFNSLWLLPESTAVMNDGTVRLRINGSDNVCRPSQQTSNYTNPSYPKLKAAPGDYVAAKYLENGHVTLPWNQPGKPLYGGTVYVYGTTEPNPDQKIVDAMKWTSDGKGGDGRGRLITAQNFDDGRCHQINDCYMSVERQAGFPNKIPGQGVQAEQWCETDIQIPKDVGGKTLTTYWVWQWPTEPGNDCTFPDGKDEYYTTCADFDVEEAARDDLVKIADMPDAHTLPLENFQTNAVPTYTARTAYTTQPVLLDDWHNRVARPTYTANSSWLSFCTSSMMSAQSVASALGFPASTPPLCPPGKWATGTLAAFYSSKGLEMAKSEATAVHASPTAAPAAITHHPAGHRPTAGGKPTVSVTTVKSTITTVYTSTVTLTSSAAAVNPAAVSDTADSHLPTVSTIGVNGVGISAQAVSASSSALPTVLTTDGTASDCNNVVYVTVSASGIAGEHIARHRAHARQFGA